MSKSRNHCIKASLINIINKNNATKEDKQFMLISETLLQTPTIFRSNIIHDIFVIDLSPTHYNYVTISAMTSQITSLAIVYSTVYSGADQRKHRNSASLAFVWGIQWWPVNSPHKGPVMQCFHLMRYHEILMLAVLLNTAMWDVPEGDKAGGGVYLLIAVFVKITDNENSFMVGAAYHPLAVTESIWIIPCLISYKTFNPLKHDKHLLTIKNSWSHVW